MVEAHTYGFSYTLNDMQPLGVVAKAEEQIAVYLGVNGSANVELVFTQYFPEYSNWKTKVANLKKGQNIITVPKLTTRDVEKGGQIYIRYTSTSATNTDIKVRVSGGKKIPVLDIHGITDELLIKDKIKTYITELTEHVAGLSEFYKDKPYGYDYDKITSILNSTDIVMDDVMLSIPATEALKGIGASNSNIEQINRLYNSGLAWKEMIGLFYKEKGLSKTATNSKDKWPGSRLNIRYTRMFDGAFMYAAGEHIGIGFGSSAGMMGGNPAREVDGVIKANYFGWGIAHEIGHVIDQRGYASAEITNNIYSLLAQTADDITHSRLENSNKYNGIYKKVTSHTEGLPGDVFVALGMYWQLHLAYDNEKTLTSSDTFYSRFNTLYRNNGGSGTDTLICYASKAAGKDLTEYFKAWGIYVKDAEAVKTYMTDNNLEPETRPIYYINDDARRYRLNGGSGIQGIETVTATQSLDNQNKIVKLTFEVANANDILGYEILRNGKSVGFVTDGEYTDELNALNNRALTYEIVVYDKLLNEVGRKKLEEIKIAYDGTISKTNFTITSNMRNESDENEYEAEEIVTRSIENMIDGELDTIFNGNTRKTSTEKNTPYFVIDLNESLPICGLRYTAATQNGQLLENTIQRYNIYVSKDISQNENWKLVRTGTFSFDENNQATVYFNANGGNTENQLYTITGGYVRIEAVGNGNKGISGAEIDIITPPGDNIESGTENIFKLSESYIYGTGENDVIPEGSVVIKATYRGNPAYNVVAIADKDGKLISLDSENKEQSYNTIFTATVPDDMQECPLEEISKGYCIIYMDKSLYETIKAKYIDGIRLNLYRVNNAQTNEGERLVSDTLLIEWPESLQSAVLTTNSSL